MIVGVQKGIIGVDVVLELQEEFDGELEFNQYDQVIGVFQVFVNGQVVVVINDNIVNVEFVNN